MTSSILDKVHDGLDPVLRERLDTAIAGLVKVKRDGKQIVVVTGSGPNIHEGVTTLVAELVAKGIVDGVSTSSAVVAHEMAGALDKVKRVDGKALGFTLQDAFTWDSPVAGKYHLPRGEIFEFTELTAGQLDEVAKDFPVDRAFMQQGSRVDGKVIIKAAGNMAYPMGPRTDVVAETLLATARELHEPLEKLAGLGSDPRTMIGAGARRGVPVLVSLPQMVGGGNVGICVGDSIPIRERCTRLARVLSGAGAIIESALALAQEIHDGPYETYTGHGIWAGHAAQPAYTLKDKLLVRMDMDPALNAVWEHERSSGSVQQAINDGKPKTKLFNVPFRMEMSGFARLEGSLPLVGDIGAVWPLLARGVAEGLGITLDFTSYPQGTPEGQAMREWIAREVGFFSFDRYRAGLDGMERGGDRRA